MADAGLYFCAVALGAAALWLLGWSCWGDPSRGRPRCGRCFYSMNGPGSGTLAACPECGWSPRRPSDLHRTRRRRGWGACAIALGIIAGAAGVAPKARRDGPWSLAPTWLLLKAAQWQGVPDQALSAAIWERLGRGEAWAMAAPAVYAQNPRLRLVRPVWVKGVPVRGRWSSTFVDAGSYRALSLYLEPSRDTARLRSDAEPTEVQSHENWWTPDTIVVSDGRDSAGTQHFEVTVVSINHCGMVEPPPPFRVPVVMKDSLDEVMRPVSVDSAVLLKELSPRLFVLPTTRNLALSVKDVAPAAIGVGVALGVKAELLVDGRVIATARWYQSTERRTVSGRPVLVRFADGRYEKNSPMSRPLVELAGAGCTVRFSADQEMALAADGCERCWRGSVEVPLASLVR